MFLRDATRRYGLRQEYIGSNLFRIAGAFPGPGWNDETKISLIVKGRGEAYRTMKRGKRWLERACTLGAFIEDTVPWGMGWLGNA